LRTGEIGSVGLGFVTLPARQLAFQQGVLGRVYRLARRRGEVRELDAQLVGELLQHRLDRELEAHRAALAVDAVHPQRFDAAADTRELLEDRDAMAALGELASAVETGDSAA